MIFIICFFFISTQQIVTDTVDVHLTLARAAAAQVGITLRYVPAYERLVFPGGDVPLERGVCSDVIVRAFRKIGIDLQKRIYEDKKNNIDAYPDLWDKKLVDRNIDHRRVPNIMTYFDRQGRSIEINSVCMPGDIIAWKLPSGLYHIGIVSKNLVQGKNRYYMIHNIGSGTKLEDVLNEYSIIGHYRW